MLRLHDYPASGNCYKVRLLLAHLGLPHERVTVDVLAGEGRSTAHRARNPWGRVPVLELEDGTCLAESNAILCYLAEGTPWLPEDRLERARVLQWLFFEQNAHEPNIASARFWLSIAKQPEHPGARLAERQAQGIEALQLMTGWLDGRDYLVGQTPTIADLSLYAYTHVAAEGGFELEPYPALRAWLARIAALPGHVEIEA